MFIENQPAIPVALPRLSALRDNDRLMRSCSSALTALTAAVSVLVVAVVALALGIT
jgi:hypothetical protein